MCCMKPGHQPRRKKICVLHEMGNRMETEWNAPTLITKDCILEEVCYLNAFHHKAI